MSKLEDAIEEALAPHKAAEKTRIDLADQIIKQIKDCPVAVESYEKASILSRVLEKIENEGDELSFLSQSLVEVYAARKIGAISRRIEHLHADLKTLGFDEENELRFCDDDDFLFHIPHKQHRIFAFGTDLPVAYLFIIEHSEHMPDRVRRYHCRRVWETFEGGFEGDEKKYKQAGIMHAILHADNLSKNYSDNVLKNGYVHRPDLKWYKDRDFKLPYGDKRDPGYVWTIERPDGGPLGSITAGLERCEDAIANIPAITRSLFYMNVCETAVDEARNERKL